jgi:hypothetical protein
VFFVLKVGSKHKGHKGSTKVAKGKSERTIDNALDAITKKFDVEVDQ